MCTIFAQTPLLSTGKSDPFLFLFSGNVLTFAFHCCYLSVWNNTDYQNANCASEEMVLAAMQLLHGLGKDVVHLATVGGSREFQIVAYCHYQVHVGVSAQLVL